MDKIDKEARKKQDVEKDIKEKDAAVHTIELLR